MHHACHIYSYIVNSWFGVARHIFLQIYRTHLIQSSGTFWDVWKHMFGWIHNEPIFYILLFHEFITLIFKLTVTILVKFTQVIHICLLLNSLHRPEVYLVNSFGFTVFTEFIILSLTKILGMFEQLCEPCCCCYSWKLTWVAWDDFSAEAGIAKY